MSLGRLIDWLLRRPASERVLLDAEVARLTMRSAETLRRAEGLVRLARVDAEMGAGTAKQRAKR